MKVLALISLSVVLTFAIVVHTSEKPTGDNNNLKVHTTKPGTVSKTDGPPVQTTRETPLPTSTSRSKKDEQAPPPVKLSPEEILLQNCPIGDGFSYPVGAPDAKGYRDVQPFGRNYHLGEDWNGGSGGNSDLGDTIYTIASGVVTYAEPVGSRCRYGWGNVVKVVHNAGTKEKPEYVESLYAHLTDIHVKQNQIVKRGDPIGTMGTCNGAYWSHLHFELRSEPFLPIGRGYGANQKGYLDPKKFIEKHRFDSNEPTGKTLFAGRPSPKSKR